MIDPEALAEALGASRVRSLPGLPSQGPLDLLELREDVRRLQAAGSPIELTGMCAACSTVFACTIPSARARDEPLFCPSCGERVPPSARPAS